MNSRESPPRDKEDEFLSEEKAVSDLQEEAAEIWEKGRILMEQFTEFSESLLAIKSNPRLGLIFDKKTSGAKKVSIIVKRMLGL